MKAYLILEDGTVFAGTSIGSARQVISEIVFNTSMTGYLEVLTDPSYAGQAVAMTYPLIGNYGICRDDMESKGSCVDGLIVRELSPIGSNFRNEQSVQEFLAEQDIPGIAGIDTRALTKILREKGTMNGMITTADTWEPDDVIRQLKEYRIRDVVDRVTTKHIVSYRPGDLGTAADVPVAAKVAVLDVGTKFNIARCLLKRGCEVMIYPSYTSAADLLAAKPDGIMITNGPGDPKDCKDIIRTVKQLYESGIPVFAICLGHQLMALANGADTVKMKYGHRGANHPVRDTETGRVYISSQNHGYVVQDGTIPDGVAEVSFINVNDGTVEGLKYKQKPVFTVQFHPEACAGPGDSEVLFDRFIKQFMPNCSALSAYPA